MALEAWCGYMSPGKRELAVVVIIRSAYSSGRMALVTWKACIGISSHIIMFAVHIRLVVRMAVNTTEGLITWG